MDTLSRGGMFDTLCLPCSADSLKKNSNEIHIASCFSGVCPGESANKSSVKSLLETDREQYTDVANRLVALLQ